MGTPVANTTLDGCTRPYALFDLQVDHGHPPSALRAFTCRHGLTTRAILSLAFQHPHRVHKLLDFIAPLAVTAAHLRIQPTCGLNLAISLKLDPPHVRSAVLSHRDVH